jgi:hypothetical protein
MLQQEQQLDPHLGAQVYSSGRIPSRAHYLEIIIPSNAHGPLPSEGLSLQIAHLRLINWTSLIKVLRPLHDFTSHHVLALPPLLLALAGAISHPSAISSSLSLGSGSASGRLTLSVSTSIPSPDVALLLGPLRCCPDLPASSMMSPPSAGSRGSANSSCGCTEESKRSKFNED